MRYSSIAVLLVLLSAPLSFPQEGDRFVWAQLKYPGNWDPYPGVHRYIMSFIERTTSISPLLERRIVTLDDPGLFSAPFLVLAGKGAPPDLSDEHVHKLRSYLTSGGFLWIEDTAGQRASPFDRWVRRTLRAVFPDSELKPIPGKHTLFKSFYLVRSVAGRTSLSNVIEGVEWGRRTCVVYSRNDVLGTWVKDVLGKYLFRCVPGGELQRMNARKVSANIILYCLTGSYKSDAVHQPFILRKLRRWK